MKQEEYNTKNTDQLVLSDKNTQLAIERTELAIERTALAADRSLQAWIRTALSMISFGFTIYKILLAMANENLTMTRASQPRNIGLFLIFLGTASVVVGMIEYFQTLQRLDKLSEGKYHQKKGFPFYVGMALAALGAFLFFSILINREFF